MSPPQAIPQAVSPSKSVDETLWWPLREVIQQYSEATGNRVRLGGTLQQNEGLLDRVYSPNDPSWLEDFSRIEIFNEQTGKREIILLKSHSWQPSAGSSLITRSTRKRSRARTSPTQGLQKDSRIENPAPAGQALSREKLQQLAQGSIWKPLPATLYKDPEYREFFTKIGVKSPQDLETRKYARMIRKAARRLLNSMRAN